MYGRTGDCRNKNCSAWSLPPSLAQRLNSSGAACVRSVRGTMPRGTNHALIRVRKLFIGFKLQHSPIRKHYGKMRI
jgi:hypothetical protein